MDNDKIINEIVKGSVVLSYDSKKRTIREWEVLKVSKTSIKILDSLAYNPTPVWDSKKEFKFYDISKEDGGWKNLSFTPQYAVIEVIPPGDTKSE